MPGESRKILLEIQSIRQNLHNLFVIMSGRRRRKMQNAIAMKLNTFTKLQRNIITAIIIFFLSFFLSRAVFFDISAPFFIPLWAYINLHKKEYKNYALLGGAIGALTLDIGQLLILILQLLLYSAFEKTIRGKLLIVKVAAAVFIGQFVWQTLYYQQLPTSALLVSISIDVILTVFISLFLKRSMFILDLKEDSPRGAESLISLWIIIAIALTGTITIQIGHFNLALFLLHLIICINAFYSPFHLVIMSTTMIAGLYSVSTLSFTSMITVYILTAITASFSKPFRQIGIACFSFIPSFFFLLFDATLPLDSVYFSSIICASFTFIFLPLRKIFVVSENNLVVDNRSHKPEETVEREIDNLMSYLSFMQRQLIKQVNNTQQTEKIMGTEFDVCMNCVKFDNCWAAQKGQMRQHAEQWFFYNKLNYDLERLKVEDTIGRHCIRKDRFLKEIAAQSIKQITQMQMNQAKKMFALQLNDVMKNVETNVQHLSKDGQRDEMEHALIQQMLQQDIDCIRVQHHINRNDARTITVYVNNLYSYTPHVENKIVQILDNHFQENFHCTSYEKDENQSIWRIRFEAVIRFEFNYKVFSRSKKRHYISGDAHSVLMLNDGLAAFLLSDGMGHNEQARKESDELIEWMKELLACQMSPEVAMHTMHYLYSLKNDSEIYATLDVAFINLMNGKLYCWKAGGMGTYIVRGNRVIKVNSYSPPIGSSAQFFVSIGEQELKSNDMIVLVSDGLFSERGNWDEQEQFFCATIARLLEKNISIHTLLYELIDEYAYRYPLTDDCTIIAIEVKHIHSEWKIIRSNAQILV